MATITTTVIPYSSNDLVRPGAGAEWWNGQDYADLPVSGTRRTPTDFYFRFVWVDIEKVTQGNYNWTRFDQEFNKANAVGAKFSFGIFMVNDSDNFLAEEFFNGTSARYPKYVHDAMQAESVKDYVTNGQWIPNWNSTFMLDRYQAMLIAVRDHIISKGWQDRIGYIDIRGYGQWGEWHSVGFGDPVSSMPAGTRPTVATYKRFVDAHIAAFPNWQLVMMLAALDANWLNNTLTPPEVTDYILKASNARGLIGIRRDQWGARGNNPYINDYLQNNNRSWNGGPAFKTLIMERWKTAPWVGEPIGPGADLSGLEQEVIDYRAVSHANGNYTKGGTSDGFIRNSSKRSGYRLQIEGGSYTNTATSLAVTLNWRNSGLTPTYEDWDVVFSLKNSSGVSTQVGKSLFVPRKFLPNTTATVVTDNFNVSVPTGNYTLSVKVVDPKGYRSPMPLFIENRQADGSYNLGSVTIGTATPNQPPTVVVNSGTIQLPSSTFTLTATAADGDGTVSSYAWTKVSGPAGGNIASPSTASTAVAALQAGTYVFRVVVTDNQGATATADSTVTVSAAVNVPPTASAGGDKSITLPTNTTTLTGTASDVDGTFTIQWTKVSGSGTISSPNVLTTNITGLTEGTSVFRLTVTDNNGASVSDTVNVVTNPAPVGTVKADAGPDQKILIPNSTTTLDGSASGTAVTSWGWRKTVGPTGGTITNANKAVATVAGLQKGVYIYELRVVDTSGAFTTDTVAVVVEEPTGTQKVVVDVQLNTATYKVIYNDGSFDII